MNRTSFPFIPVIIACLVLCTTIGLGTFVHHSNSSNSTINIVPYLLLSGTAFLVLMALLIFVSGLVALRHRDLTDIARVAWVLVMLLFPVIGSLVFLFVCSGNNDQKVA